MRKITKTGAACRNMLMVIGATLATSTLASLEAAASTKPYQINGRWYSPHGASGYDSTGVASWYGPGFHGRKTANGETYDQWGWTAAHPTLPMGTQVYVTNTRTGKTVKVRINDRGPFAGGRIIDLSRSVAESLGIKDNGVGRVRVRHAGLGAPNDDKRGDDKRVIARKKDDDVKPKIAEKSKSEPASKPAKVATAPTEPKPTAKPAAKPEAKPVAASRPAAPPRPPRQQEPQRNEELAWRGMADAGRLLGDPANLRLIAQLESEAIADVQNEWRKALAAARKA